MSARQKFADELRAWREKKGWTQEEAAREFCMSLSNYRKIEGCQRKPQRDLALLADEKFECPKTFERRYEEVLAEPYPDWFGPRVVYEDRASVIHEWEMRGVPGLLQTHAYTRAVVRSDKPYLSEGQVTQTVKDRMERQEILRREHPPKLWSVLTEGVLRQLVGGPTVMREQLDHLIALADSPGVVLQVLPFTATDVPGMNGPLTMFEFDDATSKVCYLEGWKGGQVVEDPKSVAELADTLTLIKSCAASPTDSMQLMARIRSEF